jgi:hypothetical protein
MLSAELDQVRQESLYKTCDDNFAFNSSMYAEIPDKHHLNNYSTKELCENNAVFWGYNSV